MSAAFSPIIAQGAWVLPLITRGMIEASTTRKPSTPRAQFGIDHGFQNPGQSALSSDRFWLVSDRWQPIGNTAFRAIGSAKACGPRPCVPTPAHHHVNPPEPRKRGARTRLAVSGVFTQQCLHRLRLAEQPALRIHHAKFAQKVGLRLAFHAFGNHGKTERTRDAHDVLRDLTGG